MFEKLDDIQKQIEDWKEDHDAPSPLAFEKTRIVLHTMEKLNINATQIRTCADPGISIQWLNGDKYADVEIYNDGEMCAIITTYDEKENVYHYPVIWEVIEDDIETSLRRIDGYMRNEDPNWTPGFIP